jgi:hypothetical protein
MVMEYMDKNHFNNSMNAKIAPIDDIDHGKLHTGPLEAQAPPP